MRMVLAAMFLGLAGACAPGPQADAGCAARAETTLTTRNGPMTITAIADGPDCVRAAAMLSVRDQTGTVLWTGAYSVEQVASLLGRNSPAELRQALAEWIDPERSPFRGAADLPEWAPAAEAPMSGEFPFYPESWVDPATYNDLRARNEPLYCFVQGFESQACLLIEDGRAELIGVQTFPG